MAGESPQFTTGRHLPQLDGLVRTPAGDDLPVGTEGDCIDRFLMAGLYDKRRFLRQHLRHPTPAHQGSQTHRSDDISHYFTSVPIAAQFGKWISAPVSRSRY